MDVSFCIITDGKEPKKLDELIDSIRAMEIPVHEIIVVGNPPEDLWAADLCISVPELAEQGRLGAMRNRACREASGAVLIVCDDDMLFREDFYQNLGDFDDVLCGNIRNPDGTRFWGWCSSVDGKSKLEDFSTLDDGTFYMTGGLCIMKREVFDKIQWDEDLGFYEGEDLDFSRRLHEAGYTLKLNPQCLVTHQARYTQRGKGVFARDAVVAALKVAE
jgi:glycosyltransferase involved in cell wall biosynthesis